MDTVFIASIFVATLGVWFALVRLPVWCFRSIHRHRLWEERDAIADEILTGKLKRGHPAVRELLAVAEHSANETHRLSILDLFFWRSVHRRCDMDKMSVLATSDAGLTERELKLVAAHRDRIVTLSIRSMLVGSWLGILTIFVHLLPAVVMEVRMEVRKNQQRRRVSESIKSTLVVATDEASSKSRIGRAARQFINLEDGIVIKGAATGGREPIGI